MKIKDGALTTELPDTTPVMTHEEWLAEGRRRFGKDYFEWRFVCPICGNVAAVGEHGRYKDQGATPDSAVQECIGRYRETKYRAFRGERGKPCDYAVYGLFRLPGVIVVAPDGKKMMAFAFAEAE